MSLNFEIFAFLPSILLEFEAKFLKKAESNELNEHFFKCFNKEIKQKTQRRIVALSKIQVKIGQNMSAYVFFCMLAVFKCRARFEIINEKTSIVIVPPGENAVMSFSLTKEETEFLQDYFYNAKAQLNDGLFKIINFDLDGSSFDLLKFEKKLLEESISKSNLQCLKLTLN